MDGWSSSPTEHAAAHAAQAAPGPDVDFVVKHLRRQWPDIATLRACDVDGQAHRFRGGINNWIVQSFLQLREPLAAAGIRARITDRFEPNAICIAHRDHLNSFTDFCERAYVVAVRADRPPVRIGQRQIVQNLVSGRRDGERFLPLWPQPGLIPRDARRGGRIERAAYFGRDGSMPDWLRDPRYVAALRDQGVDFAVRSREWNDYSDVDLVLAHRIVSPTLLREKPASKLTNAWLAGVPALLSDEPAYAALRRSALDYLSVDSPRSLLRAIRQLQDNRALYFAMIENGRRRALDFGVDAVRARWLDFILGDAVPDFWRSRRSAPSLLRFPPFVARLVCQKLAAKSFRRRAAAELLCLRCAAVPQLPCDERWASGPATIAAVSCGPRKLV